MLKVLPQENRKTKVAVLEILGAVCLVPGGHRKVLEAMLHFQKYAAERTRFQTLISNLDCSTGAYKEDVTLKTAIMSFINAALRCGPGQEHLEFRLHLRYEFLMLGIQPVIEKLRKHENATLDRHLDFFEMMRNEDERQLAKKFDNVHVDTKSAYSMFDMLRKKLTLTTAYPHFMSFLQHLLMLPFGNDSNIVGVWSLVDRIVQQVVLQQKNGADPDGTPLEISVKQAVRQMSSDTDIKSYQQKLREMEKANEELQNKLTKMDRECEIRAEEKDELSSTVTRMKTKLEKEMANHAQLKDTITDLNAQIENLKAQLSAERGERQKLTHLVKTGSLPDDAKVGLSSASILDVDLKVPSSTGGSTFASSVPPPPAPAPPPPPPPAAPGAPPPPPPGGTRMKKNIPQPKNPMKSFNWSKLAENKIQGTLWSQVDSSKVYSQLDLEDFEKTFSAYQRKSNEDEDMAGSTRTKVAELSVIDGRRAQNCTILLSKLKLTNEELMSAILSMDSREDLPKDMLEQLLKFVPTAEESQLLSEHSSAIDQMARADRFLYEASKITHYEGKLSALYFKKKFQERMSDIRPKIYSVIEATKELKNSRKLKKLLELVLAFGNFMNKGQRGNASGFRLCSLNNIIDTKSSVNKNVTLLHYLVETLEKKFPDVLKLEADLPNVKLASKVNITELDKEIEVLKSGITSIENELKFFEGQMLDRKDRFVTVMTDFIAVASYNFSEVEENRAEMYQKYETILQTFGENIDQYKQPDEFFGIFDNFMTSLVEAQAENERIKKQREEEEKRAKLEEQLKKERERIRSKRGESPMTSTDEHSKSKKGEFDELISALRTGDVFGEDLVKMRRNRKRTPQRDDSRERGGVSKTQKAL
ncbi:hypothetical protein KUTeg_013203 [Tegillarca granosa]|uniref:Disheveled-associated activator of morphogenesis 1 n=1 Tax=Tegillarca granosa TaxID=220873 RepID=A0ABQ9ET01_TEGGR|nr:hypothetical protein KUTeg_013203 [Tegillarca granosa]